MLFSDARFYLDFLPKTMQPFGFSFGDSYLNSTSLGLKIFKGFAMFCYIVENLLTVAFGFPPTDVATLIPLAGHQAALEGKFGKPSF